MPIDCRIKFPRLTDAEMRAIDYRVMGHVFDAQNELGHLCDESVYQLNLAERLSKAGFDVALEEPVTLTFGDFRTTLYLDLVVDQQVVYELKTVKKLLSEHEEQLLNYLFVTNVARGKLINFRSESVESKYINSRLDHADRHDFSVDVSAWNGDPSFLKLATELVQDWGTCLDQSLYLQAIVVGLGGKGRVVQQLPMTSRGRSMGLQRFHLADQQTAFRVTTFNDDESGGYAVQLQKLLSPSPLNRLYWINISRHQLRFETLHREGISDRKI
mgnify:CR=1 FL=1